MARIRTLKPEFWTDEKLSELPESVHMLAAALLNYADDEGYFNANPALVKAACFPLREPSVSVHGGLTQLCDLDYIRIANGIDGRSYGWVVGFAKHQRVNRPTPSRIKGLVASWERSVSIHGGLTEPSVAEQGTGNREVEEEQGSGTGSNAADAAAQDELFDWLVWWNSLKADGLVGSSVSEDEPSEAISKAWKRVCGNARLCKLLSDRDAIRREIQASSLCRAGWFRLEKLFGGKNRDHELIVRKLLDGGYRDDERKKPDLFVRQAVPDLE